MASKRRLGQPSLAKTTPTVLARAAKRSDRFVETHDFHRACHLLTVVGKGFGEADSST